MHGKRHYPLAVESSQPSAYTHACVQRRALLSGIMSDTSRFRGTQIETVSLLSTCLLPDAGSYEGCKGAQRLLKEPQVPVSAAMVCAACPRFALLAQYPYVPIRPYTLLL